MQYAHPASASQLAGGGGSAPSYVAPADPRENTVYDNFFNQKQCFSRRSRQRTLHNHCDWHYCLWHTPVPAWRPVPAALPARGRLAIIMALRRDKSFDSRSPAETHKARPLPLEQAGPPSK